MTIVRNTGMSFILSCIWNVLIWKISESLKEKLKKTFLTGLKPWNNLSAVCAWKVWVCSCTWQSYQECEKGFRSSHFIDCGPRTRLWRWRRNSSGNGGVGRAATLWCYHPCTRYKLTVVCTGDFRTKVTSGFILTVLFYRK